MKIRTIKIIMLILVLGLTLCTNKKENCIKGLMEEKDYSYDEAKEACEEAASDSVRR
jgi:hypothetical protein